MGGKLKALRWWARRSWLPFGLRDRVLRAMADPDSMPPTPFVADFLGFAYHGDLSRFLDWTVYFYGSYEAGVMAFLGHCLNRTGSAEAVALDIGANVGLHSLFLSRRAGTVHAFEPWEPARQVMQANLAANAVTNVHLHPLALSDRDGEAVYYAPTTANTGTGSFLPLHNLSNREALAMPLARGDDVIERLGLSRVDLIKIDTEGYERRVLAGLSRTLARCRPVVVFEMSPAAGEELGDAADVRALFGAGWRLYRLETTGPDFRLAPFLGKADGSMAVAVPKDREAPIVR